MRWVKTYESFSKVKVNKNYLTKMLGASCTVNDDGSIDVFGNVDLKSKGLKYIPFKFNKVTGDFDCSNNQLVTLTGSPKFVGGKFKCSQNRLTNLYNAPEEVGGDFECWNNHIGLLDGCPHEIGGNMMCMGNYITKLNTVASISGNIDCRDNKLDPKNHGFSGWCGGKIIFTE